MAYNILLGRLLAWPDDNIADYFPTINIIRHADRRRFQGRRGGEQDVVDFNREDADPAPN